MARRQGCGPQEEEEPSSERGIDEEITRRARECPEGDDDSHVAAGGESEGHVAGEDQDSEEIERRSAREYPGSGELQDEGDRVRSQPTTGAHRQPPINITTAAQSRPSGHVTNFVVTHPSQTRFTCPDANCRLTYPTHHSLVRHMDVSHKHLKLNITFQCALCEYTHANLRSTSLHFRHTHGVAVPPLPIDGTSEKACPYCQLTFPSKNSCSKHIREKHMEAASAQRAREAAEKVVSQGESTARKKWSEIEINKFKEALAKFGPDSNIKISDAIGTRTAAQVNVYKWRFFKAYPSWLQQNYHPVPPTATTSSSRRSPSSSRPTPENRSPSAPSEIQAPSAANTRSGRSSSATSESHSPPGPNPTRRQKTADNRALPAKLVPTRRRRVPPPTSPTSPAPSPPGVAAAGRQLPTRLSTPNTPPQAAVSARQHCSPGAEATSPTAPPVTPPSQPTQEEMTPSPPPAPLTEETMTRLQRLEEQLRALRSAPLDTEGVEAQCSTPPQAALPTPTPTSPPAEEERAPLPPPAPILGGRALGDQLLEVLDVPTPTDTDTAMWDPEALCFSPPPMDLVTPSTSPLAMVSARMNYSPGVGVARQPQSPPAATTPAPASTPPLTPVIDPQQRGDDAQEGTQAPPPRSVFYSLLHIPPLVPAIPPMTAMVQRLDQALQSLRGGEAPDTSPPPTPPSSPVHTPPPTMVSARQHHSMEMGAAASQPPTVLPAAMESVQPTPLSPPGLPPPPTRVPGPLERIVIDPDNMDPTLRLPFHQELLPFADRMLGDFEWVAFECVLDRWSTAIKEVVIAQRRRPPHPTSQWARRQRRRQAGNQPQPQSPSPPPSLPPDPSQSTEPQVLNTPNNRASGRARQAAKSRYLQKLYRSNPGACMRRILDNGPPVYCTISEPDLVGHFTTNYAESPPLGPPPAWLFPDRQLGETGVSGATDEGDVLQSPFTPEEVVTQFKRTKRTSPGIDGITYANWRWVDPKGLILATIFNICRINSRVPRPWKHSTVTLIHKGGDTANIRNWRPISLQLTVYKLYSAMIARRIASWAIGCSAFSAAQKGFLAFDGCAEHNFLLIPEGGGATCC